MKKIIYTLGASIGLFIGSILLAQAAPSVFAIFQGGTGASSIAGNAIVGSNAAGTAYIATGTPQLTVGNILSTTTATSTFIGGITANILNTSSTTASSTFANGLNLKLGCLAYNGTCITQNSGSVTSITAGTGLLGGTITTSGTITNTIATSSIPVLSSIPYWTNIGTTGTALVGNVATSSPTFNGGLTTSGTAGAWVGGSGYTVSISAPVSIANGGTNATSMTTSNSVVGYNGTSLVTAPLTSAFTFPFASSTSITSSSSVYAGTTAGGLAVGTTSPTNIPTGGVIASSTILSFEYNVATGTSQTIDWSAGNSQLLRIFTAGITVSFTNNKPGEKLTLNVCNPHSGTAGTVTWPSTVRWAGGTLPTQTTTADHCDVWSFIDSFATSTEIQQGAQTANF